MTKSETWPVTQRYALFLSQSTQEEKTEDDDKNLPGPIRSEWKKLQR